MRLKMLSLILLAGSCAPSLAQDSTDVLRQALDRMPEMLLTNPDPMQVFFLDVQAWRGLVADGPSTATMLRLAIAHNIEPLSVLNYGGLSTWDEKAGVALGDISYLAGFGQPPFMVAFWGFDDAGTAAALIDTLEGQGFSDVAGPVAGTIGNGEASAISIQDRDPANPWRGALGKSYFALALDDIVIQAPAPEAMAALSQIEPAAGDSAIVGAALDGLSATIGVDQGRIVQAMVISPVFGLESGDPMALLGAGDIDAAKAALEAALADSSKGIPPYFGGIVADVQIDDRPAVALSLAYADCETADLAIAALEARWADNMSNAAEASGSSVANEGQLCAASMTFVGAEAPDGGNPLLQELMNRVINRDFNLLQIGTAS